MPRDTPAPSLGHFLFPARVPLRCSAPDPMVAFASADRVFVPKRPCGNTNENAPGPKGKKRGGRREQIRAAARAKWKTQQLETSSGSFPSPSTQPESAHASGLESAAAASAGPLEQATTTTPPPPKVATASATPMEPVAAGTFPVPAGTSCSASDHREGSTIECRGEGGECGTFVQVIAFPTST